MSARFDDFREIAARFESRSTACGTKTGGHDITVGELIGYASPGRRSHSRGHTMCADCWAAWRQENAEADLAESGQW